MALTVQVNIDTQDLTFGTSGVNYVQWSENNDKIIFTAGNTEVQDGADIPTEAQLISAGVELDGTETILDTYLFQDTSANELFDIPNMGNVDKSFVICASFDDITASEPVLEFWDDTNLTTISNTLLGGGTPSSSMVRGIVTTTSNPGSNWVTGATRLAGSADGHFLLLNDGTGFLDSAKDLYFNLAIVIPSSQTQGFSANAIPVIKWLQN